MRLNYTVNWYNENPASALSMGLQLTIQSGYGAIPQARIYLVGTGPPAFELMEPLGVGYHLTKLPLAAGTYQIDYTDISFGATIKILGRYTIFELVDSCFNDVDGAYIERGQNGSLKVSDVNILVTINRPHDGPIGSHNKAVRVSLDGMATFKTILSSLFSVSWTNAELAALGLENGFAQLTIERQSNACTVVQSTDNFIQAAEYDDMDVIATPTNISAIGEEDGTIILTITGGSGLRSYVWADGPVTQNRSGLAPGFYTVTVTDSITDEVVSVEDIEVTEPAPVEIPVGTLLEFPMLNSFKWVVDPRRPSITADSDEITADSDEVTADTEDSSVGMTPDNTLFADIAIPGFAKGCYYDKRIFSDAPVSQFKSDFSSHLIQLIDYITSEVIKTMSAELKEENIGVSDDYVISIRNNPSTAGTSRVYFAVGPLPIPLQVGDVFEIINNAEDFNGAYEILEIVNDVILGYQYLVITLVYDGAAPTSAGTGRFLSNLENYNVFEFATSFFDVPEGIYYVKVSALSVVGVDNVISKIGITEPIRLKAVWPTTALIEYRNEDNGHGDITWTTGYIGRRRVECVPPGIKRLTSGGERGVSRNSDYSPVKTFAKRVRAFLFETIMLPPYLHESLGWVFDCDSWSINGVQYQSTEAYADPTYLFKSLLSNSSIRIEQKEAVGKYNSHDIGTVADGDVLESESGSVLQI